MFTVEFLQDRTVVTSLDEADTCEDVQLVITDECVLLLQYEELMGGEQTILISYQQLLDLFNSLNQTEGSYYTER
jgi:hypothetical protein